MFAAGLFTAGPFTPPPLAAQAPELASTPGPAPIAADSSDGAGHRYALIAAGAVAAATWNQSLRVPKAWPQTWRGYGSRLGDQVGFAVAEEALRAGIGTVVPWRSLDARCEAAHRGRPFGARVGAATRCSVRGTFLAADREGRTRPNVPLLGAIVGASVVSLAWRPERADARDGQLFVTSRIGIVLAGTVANRAWGAWRGR